jgi:hypothetical protein
MSAEKRQWKERTEANGSYEKEQVNVANNKLPINFKVGRSVSWNNFTYLPSRLDGFFGDGWA